jgi:hypothetical protein
MASASTFLDGLESETAFYNPYADIPAEPEQLPRDASRLDVETAAHPSSPPPTLDKLREALREELSGELSDEEGDDAEDEETLTRHAQHLATVTATHATSSNIHSARASSSSGRSDALREVLSESETDEEEEQHQAHGQPENSYSMSFMSKLSISRQAALPGIQPTIPNDISVMTNESGLPPTNISVTSNEPELPPTIPNNIRVTTNEPGLLPTVLNRRTMTCNGIEMFDYARPRVPQGEKRASSSNKQPQSSAVQDRTLIVPDEPEVDEFVDALPSSPFALSSLESYSDPYVNDPYNSESHNSVSYDDLTEYFDSSPGENKTNRSP